MTSDKNSPTKKVSTDYSNVPECDLLDTYILGRLKKGLHTHILVTGLQGKGKSDFGIRMGERLSRRINNGVDFKHTDIVDSLLGLIKRIKQIQTSGEIIMIEEVSVLFPSRRSMQHANVAVGRILDTIRKKQCVLISNAPLYTSIDSHMRSLAEILVECQKIIRKERLVQVKAWILQTAPHTGKTYRHRFHRKGLYPVIYHYSRQSSPEIRAAYEKEKDRFIDELLTRLESKEKQIKEKEVGKEKKLLWVQEEILRMRDEEGLEASEMAKKLKMSIRRVYNHLGTLKDHGLLVGKSKKNLEKAKNEGLTPLSVPK